MTTTNTHAAESAGAGRLAGLPFIASFAVFLPMILTSLLFLMPAFRSWAGRLAAGFPMINFVIYVLMNWTVLVPAGLFLRRYGISFSDIGFTKVKVSDLLYGGGAAVIGFFIYYIAVFLAAKIGLEPIRGMNYSLTNAPNIISALLFACLLGPLAEDIIFRGFLLSFLGARLRSKWLAGIIGVLVFTLVHIPYFGTAGALFILLWSPLLVILFFRRKSIVPCLAMHVINNLVAYLIVPLLLRK